MNRSNATLIIAKPSYNKMLKVFKDNAEDDTDFELAYRLVTEEIDNKIEDENFVSLFWNYIKWRNSFSDIYKVTEYLEVLASQIEKSKEVTKELVEQYGWELLTITEDGYSDFDCYDREEGSEGDVYCMPSLYATSETYNEIEEEHKDENITIYTVSELHVYMYDKFEIYNEIIFTTTSELKAKIEMKKEYDRLVKSFLEEDYRLEEGDAFNELNLGEEDALIQLVSDDRIELSITKTTLQK